MSDTGVVLPYEQAAIGGLPMPEGLSAPDCFLFLALRGLYAQCKNGVISREIGVAEKKTLLKKYEELKWNEQETKRYVQTIKATEAARSEYRKNRTIENADKILIAFDGVK